MEEEKKLYPFRFCLLEDTYNWGSEEFCLADLGYRDSLVKDGWLGGNAISEVMDMYCDRVVGEKVFEQYGRQFPVQVKRIKCTGKMPLVVHPDDEIAAQRYDFLGKEKLWYVGRASADARVCIGFEKDTDASSVYTGCLDGSIEGLLHCEKVKAGDFIHIKPGVVHALLGNVEVYEVSESSPLDFCLYAWGQEVSPEQFDSSLDVVAALDFIDYKAYKESKEIPQFDVRKLRLMESLKYESGDNGAYIAFVCVNGSASVKFEVLGKEASFPVKEGEVILVPDDVHSFVLSPAEASTILLEVVTKEAKPDELLISEQ